MVKRNPGRRNGSPIPAVLNVRPARQSVLYCNAAEGKGSALFLVFVSCGKPCAVAVMMPLALYSAPTNSRTSSSRLPSPGGA